jgi:protein-tyrosine sulfotransferase
MERSALHIPPESYVIGPVVRCYTLWRFGSWEAAVNRALTAFETHPEFVHFDLSLDPVRRSLPRIPHRDRSLATVIDSIYRLHAEVRGRGRVRWGDKTPLNTLYLPEIERVFPDARFVNLIRDGCDVVHSYLEMGRYDTIAAAASRWKTAVEAARSFAQGHAGAVIDVRYEDLVREPGTAMRMICSWLELDCVPRTHGSDSAPLRDDVGALPHHARVLGPVDESSVGLGRRAFDPASRRELEQLIGPTLLALGYPSPMA